MGSGDFYGVYVVGDVEFVGEYGDVFYVQWYLWVQFDWQDVVDFQLGQVVQGYVFVGQYVGQGDFGDVELFVQGFVLVFVVVVVVVLDVGVEQFVDWFQY